MGEVRKPGDQAVDVAPSDPVKPGATVTRRRRFRPRQLIWVSLLIVPADAVVMLAGGGAVLLFWLSVAALIPIAYLIGVATDQASEHTGSVVAGLLNASFGNAPELIVALFAVDRGLSDVVFGSLAGSIISNLLLVLGVSVVVAGRGRVNRRSSGTSLLLVTLALLFFAITTWLQDVTPGSDGTWSVIVPGCAVLLAAYLAVTAVSVIRSSRLHRQSASSPVGASGPSIGAASDTSADGEATTAGPEAEAADPPGGWSLPVALVVLGLATVATAFVSDVLTDSITDFAAAAGLPEFFVAAVIVAVVGNATEHGGAVVLAMSGKLELAAEIAFSSSAQVATLVLPLVVLLSLVINPLPPTFRAVELLTILVAIAVPAVMLARRMFTRVSGTVLCVAYGLIAVAFAFAS